MIKIKTNQISENNSELDNKSQNNSNNHTTKSSKNHIPKRRGSRLREKYKQKKKGE
jgi:hypothetical protein